MRQTQLFTKTLREAPAEEVATNAKLLIQAGYLQKVMAGAYAYLPLGLRVLKKIEQIIREEMNAIGGQELLMTTLQDPSLWKKTNRWNDEVVDNWFKSELKNGNEVGIANTHEEPIVEMLKQYVNSYRDIPFSVYQFQTKFRNELRAKSGIMRVREFIMKDLYSFSSSEEEFKEFYEKCAAAYLKIFERVGIGEQTYRTVAAGGSFTTGYTDEFQTITDAGEDIIFYSKTDDTYYNQEVVVSQAPKVNSLDEVELEMKDVLGEGMIGVEELAKFLDIPVEKTTKTLLYETDTGQVVAVAVRGGYQVSEAKVRKELGCQSIRLASPDTVNRVTGAEVGYAGMLNLPSEVVQLWDESTDSRVNFEMGANKTDYHTINVNFGRDIPKPDTFYDLKVANVGDIDPKTGEVFETHKAVEVGNIFPLGTKYTEALGLSITDADGNKQPIIMGSYGIGLGRLLGAVVEVHHDDKGIIWPETVAPYKYHLVSLGESEAVKKAADDLYVELEQAGEEVLYDDRNQSIGVKLSDTDLLGLPVRIVVSEKSLEQGGFEVKRRNQNETKICKNLSEVVAV